jgi:hypothetical protein
MSFFDTVEKSWKSLPLQGACCLRVEKFLRITIMGYEGKPKYPKNFRYFLIAPLDGYISCECCIIIDAIQRDPYKLVNISFVRS